MRDGNQPIRMSSLIVAVFPRLIAKKAQLPGRFERYHIAGSDQKKYANRSTCRGSTRIDIDLDFGVVSRL